IRRRIGIESGRERRRDPADDGPVIEALEERNRGHHSQKHQQPIGPATALGFVLAGMHRLERVRLIALHHRRSSSFSSGAKCCSTAASLTAASVAGCQRGFWSLSTITALTPS